jgi:hypothetical protein
MAHHPPCSRHENHLIYIAGHPLCLGCLCIGTGGLAGLLFCLFSDLQQLSFSHWIALHTAAVAPTVLQPWLQKKWFKVAARTLVGFASATWCLGALGLGPRLTAIPFILWVIGALAFFCATARALLLLRERAAKSPCSDCPLGAFPTCSWNMERESGAPDLLAEALADIAERDSWEQDIQLQPQR